MPQVGSTLTCSGGEWAGDPPPALAFSWLLAGVGIPGETQPTYLLAPEDVGEPVGCRVTATNDSGSAFADSATATVLPQAPVALTSPTLSGERHVQHTLLCSPGAWSGAPTLAYQWLLDGTAIPGASANAYRIPDRDVDHELGCAVTATNAGGGATSATEAVLVTRLAVRIVMRGPRTQRGPTFVVRGLVETERPWRSGVVDVDASVLAPLDGTTHIAPQPHGAFRMTLTVPDLVPGRYALRLAFTPHDAALYAGAAQDLNIRLLSPLEYPFARSRQDRRPDLSDDLPPFWDDGLTCSTGCRPADAVAGWPLPPFHLQHALRAGINELRPSGFHRGIDIQAKDGTPVYAIEPGVAHIIQARGVDARVQVGHYIYWHVRSLVAEGSYVQPYHQVLGYVMRFVRHLHLSEVDGAGGYLNPLRPNGRVLAPWSDDEPPVIADPLVNPDGTVDVEAFDPQSYVTRTRYVTPVLAPAALAYRLYDASGAPIGPLEWALRGTRVLPDTLIHSVFASDASEPGYFCFALRVICRPRWDYHLAGGLAPPLPLGSLAPGHYRLTAYAWDWAGNETARDHWLSVG
jgi:murein DD-endopeptidase MepM/ murein hydrolase activator NlpD